MKAGDLVHVERLGTCKVLKVRPLGTVDVLARSGKCYRLSGLPLEPREPSPTAAGLLGLPS